MGIENGSDAIPIGDGLLYRRLRGLARPYAGYLTALLGLDLLESLLVLLTPLPLKLAIDSVIGARPLPELLARITPESITASAGSLLLATVGLLCVIALLNGLQSLVTSLLRGWVGDRLVLGLRSRMFLHAQRLSLSYHDTAGTADAAYRIQKDAAAVEDILIDGALPLIGAALTVTLMFAVTLWLDWQLGLIAAAVAPILLLLSARFKRRLRQRAREVKK